MDNENDQQLLERAAQGDERAFEVFYDRYRDWVYQLAWRFCRDRDLALDVVQDTFGYLVKKLPGLRLTAKLTTFLYPVVRHIAINALRVQGRYAGPANDWLQEQPAPVPKSTDLEELASVLANLPTVQRQVVLMRYLDDMSLKEIALALSIPEGTVKSRLHHALAALRKDNRCRRYFLD